MENGENPQKKTNWLTSDKRVLKSPMPAALGHTCCKRTCGALERWDYVSNALWWLDLQNGWGHMRCAKSLSFPAKGQQSSKRFTKSKNAMPRLRTALRQLCKWFWKRVHWQCYLMLDALLVLSHPENARPGRRLRCTNCSLAGLDSNLLHLSNERQTEKKIRQLVILVGLFWKSF